MKNQLILTKVSLTKVVDSISLIEASLEDLDAFDTKKIYTPKEREPYDALSDRFIRAVEISIKFFRSYEKFLYVESSDTLRDLLNKMEKLKIINSVVTWIDMRDIRNRVVHDYLPQEIKDIYDLIMGEFARELMSLKKQILAIKFED